MANKVTQYPAMTPEQTAAYAKAYAIELRNLAVHHRWVDTDHPSADLCEWMASNYEKDV